MRKNHQAVPAVYTIVKRNNEILLLLRQNTGYYDDWYSVPSGHLEAGELPIEAAIRETKEEVGLQLHCDNIRFAHIMYRTAMDATGDRADWFFIVELWSGEPVNCEKEKCEGISWFSLDALPEKFMHHQRLALESILRGTAFSQLGTELLHQNPNKL